MRTTLILAMAIVFSAPALACGTKAGDCQNFAKVANANVEELKKADPKDHKQLAAAVKKVADGARSVQVKDEGLQPLVKEYVDLWDKESKAAGNLESSDEAVAQKATDEVMAIEKNEGAIVDKINNYCK